MSHLSCRISPHLLVEVPHTFMRRVSECLSRSQVKLIYLTLSSEKGKPEAQLNPWWRAAACCVLLWRSVEDLVLNSRVWNVFGCCFSEVQELSKFHYQMCWDVLLIVPITLFKKHYNKLIVGLKYAHVSVQVSFLLSLFLFHTSPLSGTRKQCLLNVL